jgi:hypothetical protein
MLLNYASLPTWRILLRFQLLHHHLGKSWLQGVWHCTGKERSLVRQLEGWYRADRWCKRETLLC